jgi:hypothetical protein
MKDKIALKIDTEKEVLSTMPLKTKKNKKNYQLAVNDLLKNYLKEEKSVKEEITKRYDKITSLTENPEINKINEEINNITANTYLINEYLTSYEKLGLDRVTYGLNHFYKENLVRVNKLILKAINIFKSVGIELTPAYFDYSHYTYDYMQVFFKEIQNDDLKSDLLKETFEKIYWKCPDIITHLDLNIRYLYYLNEKDINEYFANKKKELLATKQESSEKIFNDLNNLLIEKDNAINIDEATILKDFINKKKVIMDFDEAKINKGYSKLITDSEYLANNKISIDENIIKLDHSLYEYQNYLTFKFIIDDIKNKYNEKDTYKNKYKEALKNITKEEDKLRKVNFKIYKIKNSRHPKIDEIEKLINETEGMISNLKKLYDELETIKFNDRVLTMLNDNSTYLDILNLAFGDYNYLTTLIKSNDENLTEDEIKLKVYKLQTFISSPYNTIINNLVIKDEKDVSVIISDRYHLLNIDINTEKLAPESVDDLKKTTENLLSYIYIKSSNLQLNDIFFVVKVLPIINSANS